MRISDLPAPITAAKADWLPGVLCLAFTPQGTGPDAKAKCEATVQRQFGNGYVLERLTSAFGQPNAGHRNDARVADERARHAPLADSLIAVHRLQYSSLPLERIVGKDEYDWLQDVWATGDRNRWSVAFPIVESYQIVGAPKAKAVFGPALHSSLFQSQSAVLRPLNDEARECLKDLEIVPAPAPNEVLEVNEQIAFAERSQLDSKLLKAFETDLAGSWEGETVERKVKLIRRAVWLARNFAKDRERQNRLACDACGFDARAIAASEGISRRSCFDVHHRTPIADGRRYSQVADFALLCPTCHRIEHLRMKARRNSK